MPAGEYVCRIAVSPLIDRADVTEEFDFGEMTKGQDFVLLELEKGFAPSAIGIVGGEARGEMRRRPYARYLAQRDGRNPPASVGGVGETPLPPVPEPGMMLLDKITPGNRWASLIGGIELSGAAEGRRIPAQRVALLPMHVGAWRRAMSITLWRQQKAGMIAAFPISVRRSAWYNEVTDDISPFSTHEHDEDLRPSYGRRTWALYFGTETERVQCTAGHVGLDAYKEWILDWPETATASDYPRAWFTKADVDRLKKTLDRHPHRDELSRCYVFSGDPADGIRAAETMVQDILRTIEPNWQVQGLSHFRQALYLEPFIWKTDDALACPDLPADLRTRLRRALAAGAYQIADPDVNPRGSGAHLGNNNMAINRTCALIYFAGLLPDHPLYRYWMDNFTQFMRFKAGTYIAADGAPDECPGYALYGPIRSLCYSAQILRNVGGPDLSEYILRNAVYNANLTMPDVRFGSYRIIPGMGNGGNRLESIFGFVLADAERAGGDLAGRMKTFYRLCWPDVPGNLPSRQEDWPPPPVRCFPDVPESDAPLVSTVIPTYGVVFRAHFGSPDETAMLFRIGTNWGHWDTDALNVILYGKGAPLSPGTGYQYIGSPLTDNNAIYHNRVKVGTYDQQEVFGRVDNVLGEYGLGPNADYAAGSRYLPPEIFADKQGELWWNRHVMFLKSPRPVGPNYFVMRDTFTGGIPRPTWWTWLNLEGADRIAVDGSAFKPIAGGRRLPQEQMEVKRGQTLEMDTDFGASTWFWFAEPRPFRVVLTATYRYAGRPADVRLPDASIPRRETKSFLEGLGQPGQDWFCVAYPRKNGEAVPAVSRLADGCLKIVTNESTDYVFAGDAPVAFNQEGVTFSGKAGAVRVFNDRVAFCMNAGSGTIGCKGCVFSGHGPFERVVPLAQLKPGETKVTDTYEKVRHTVNLGEGLVASGEAPFTAKLDGRAIRISTDGRARVIYATKPAWMNWVQYWIDGQEWMACWTDYPNNGWGTYRNSFLIALTVPAGKHELLVKDCTYPPVWRRQFTPAMPAVLP